MTQDETYLANSINAFVRTAHTASETSGWWQDPETGLDLKRVVRSPQTTIEALIAKLLVPTKLCLTHSELSEGMEGFRKGRQDDKLPHRRMLEVELADTMIRIADLAGALGMDLGGAISEKMAFNAQRADHKLDNRRAEGGKSF